MHTLYSLIDRLVSIGVTEDLIDSTDCIYVRNRLLALFDEINYECSPSITYNLFETLDALLEVAILRQLVDDTLAHQDIFISNIMNVFLDKPSVINAKFIGKYALSPQSATDYFYNLSQVNNYIKVTRIAKNKAYTTHSPYGDIQLTINLSKPEKDPKQIALEKSMPSTNYPPCLLCIENEGYEGTLKHPDRSNHRMIRLTLNHKPWMLQYSPYLYYNEHCIILSAQHTPMQINQDTFYNLLDFTTQFPHYFIGSNADLPIVGGSILSHEHYQGGCFTFPMDTATTLFTFEIPDFPNIQAKTLNWPLSTIELRSTDYESLAQCSDKILTLWREYSDSSLDVLAYSHEIPHNTITPICKREGDDYIVRLVLRNNRTTEEHPLGIFHPHSDVHHIKKENIGLIEVMGLAILPGRLLTELDLVQNYILGHSDDVPKYHLDWANTLKSNYTASENIESYVVQSVGDKFTRVLEDAGVYKLTPEGILGFKTFLRTFATVS